MQEALPGGNGQACWFESHLHMESLLRGDISSVQPQEVAGSLRWACSTHIQEPTGQRAQRQPSPWGKLCDLTEGVAFSAPNTSSWEPHSEAGSDLQGVWWVHFPPRTAPKEGGREEGELGAGNSWASGQPC